MISLQECREILGEAGRDLSNAELESLRQFLYGLADITVSCFLADRASGSATKPKEEKKR
jgi:hypothetical protein